MELDYNQLWRQKCRAWGGQRKEKGVRRIKECDMEGGQLKLFVIKVTCVHLSKVKGRCHARSGLGTARP